MRTILYPLRPAACLCAPASPLLIRTTFGSRMKPGYFGVVGPWDAPPNGWLELAWVVKSQHLAWLEDAGLRLLILFFNTLGVR